MYEVNTRPQAPLPTPSRGGRVEGGELHAEENGVSECGHRVELRLVAQTAVVQQSHDHHPESHMQGSHDDGHPEQEIRRSHQSLYKVPELPELGVDADDPDGSCDAQDTERRESAQHLPQVAFGSLSFSYVLVRIFSLLFGPSAAPLTQRPPKSGRPAPNSPIPGLVCLINANSI